MPNFRADFEVRGSLVLTEGSAAGTITGDSPRFEICFRNAPVDNSGHVPALIASVIAEAESLEMVPDQFRALLADQLDVLSFVTQSAFRIERCQRVMDWEPHQKDRRVRPLQSFDQFYPPDPALAPELLGTAQTLISLGPLDYIAQALRSFRLGVIERQPEDQFQHFWHAIEIVAEGAKTTTRIPIPCPKCQGDLFCSKCNKTPLRRPMARQAIRDLLAKIRENGAEQYYRDLVKTRDHLLHGRTPESVEKEIGLPLSMLVNEAGKAAWHAIMYSMPKIEGQPPFAHRDGQFVSMSLTVMPDMQFTYDGATPHPREDQIPNVEISMQVRFDTAHPDDL